MSGGCPHRPAGSTPRRRRRRPGPGRCSTRAGRAAARREQKAAELARRRHTPRTGPGTSPGSSYTTSACFAPCRRPVPYVPGHENCQIAHIGAVEHGLRRRLRCCPISYRSHILQLLAIVVRGGRRPPRARKRESVKVQPLSNATPRSIIHQQKQNPNV